MSRVILWIKKRKKLVSVNITVFKNVHTHDKIVNREKML